LETPVPSRATCREYNQPVRNPGDNRPITGDTPVPSRATCREYNQPVRNPGDNRPITGDL
ncbi:predicted protein, partial [Nematostella vectensis]